MAHASSIVCGVADDQIALLISAITLPESWMDRVLAQVQAVDEVKRIQGEREEVRRRLQRLGRAYVDDLVAEETYTREKRGLEEKLASLVVPEVDAARQAGELLESLPAVWAEANLAERRRVLTAMLEAVYVDAVEEKRIVAIKPKPAFRPVFQVATTREGSDVVLIQQDPQPDEAEGLATPCSWWRRGRVELPVQQAPSGIYSRRSRRTFLACSTPIGGVRSGQPS